MGVDTGARLLYWVLLKSRLRLPRTVPAQGKQLLADVPEAELSTSVAAHSDGVSTPEVRIQAACGR